MKRTIKRVWMLTAAICVFATLSASLTVVGNHKVSEKKTSELVEIEECEAIAGRRERRSLKRERQCSPFHKMALNPVDSRPGVANGWFRPTTERTHLNGIGGYLLT